MQNTTIFSNATYKWGSGYQPSKTFNAILGSLTLDLRTMRADELHLGERMELNVVFGEITVLLNAATPVKITGNAVFGQVILPDENMVALGQVHGKTPSAKAGEHAIEIKANAVFGSVRFVIQDALQSPAPA